MLTYMSRAIKILIALVVIALVWKVVFSSSADPEIEYDPVE